MKLWIDDVRPAPENYFWAKTVNEAKATIEFFENVLMRDKPDRVIEIIDIDHDAGEFAQYGGDYIKLLDWLEETGRNYPIRIHSANVVGVQNMRRIIKRNGWREIK